MTQTKNIIISGTNFWNPGDDFVRDGVIRILREIFPEYSLNFLFYNFNQDFFPQNKFSGIHNMLSKGDIENYRDFIDYIVIAGLSAGQEIKDLYNWIIENDLTDRVYLIGAGYENDYVDKYIYEEPELTIFKNAKVITSRTHKAPTIIRELGLPFYHINCPAILSVPEIKEIPESKKIENISFSIQLPHEIGVANHSCSKEMYILALDILSELINYYNIEIIAHHKSEYFHFLNFFRKLNLNIPIKFSSYYQDLFEIYKGSDLVITTRLHSSLFANGFGIPGIIINDTDRHVHCLEGFKHSHWVNNNAAFSQIFEGLLNKSLRTIADELKRFKADLLNNYVSILSDPFKRNNGFPVRIIKENSEEVIINFFKYGASDFEVKKRVLSILEKLDKDYWLGKNIEKYKQSLHSDNGKTWFDTISFLNWYSSIFKPKSYLEVGVRRGRSMIQVLSQSKHTSAVGIDLWIEDYSCIPEQNIVTTNPGPEFVLTELKKFGIMNVPELIKGDSHSILPAYFKESHAIQYFDLMLVDGDHSYEGARCDLDICINHLKESGVLVFDDINHSSHPELKSLWSELKVQYPAYLFFEDSSGTGTGIMIKPPFNKYLRPFIDKQYNVSNENKLPVHFFTIVLNGKPFIDYHINIFKQLPFEWHWHIVEGIADFHNDTNWCKNNGGTISEEFHKNGLSNDGTTEYLFSLKEQFPKNITIYHKGIGCFWNGKLEMVNAPLKNINAECLLWEIDVDEMWNSEQIIKARELFINNKKKTAAFYKCHYFVGDDKVISSTNTYGNYTDSEWIRTWRYLPGDKWISHEPPKLCRNINNELVDISKINPFLHQETISNGLVFLHYAYVLEKNLKFKEVYYGYKNAIHQWRKLQKVSSFPTYLKNYFDWVKDDAIVHDTTSLNINSYFIKDGENSLISFNKINSEWKRIVFVRCDSIGDNIIASSLLMPLFESYPEAHFTVICQDHIAELYDTIPYVNEIVTFEEMKMHWDDTYKQQFLGTLNKINADVVINSMYSNSPISNAITNCINAQYKIGIDGDCSNIEEERWNLEKKYYTHLVKMNNEVQLEITRYKDFLKELGINRNNLIPLIWTTYDDKDFADELFERYALIPNETIAVFPFSQCSIKDYNQFPTILDSLPGYKFILLGGKDQTITDLLRSSCIDLCGKTTIRQMVEIIRKCKILIGVDSAGAHIASAVGTPNVIILGGGHFGRFLPYSNFSSIVCSPLNCFNCNWECIYGKSKCINNISPEFILEAINRSLTGIDEHSHIYIQKTEDNEEILAKCFKSFNSSNFHYHYKQEDKNQYEGLMTKPGKSENILNKAGIAIEKGSLESAKRMLEELLSTNQENTSVLNDLAVVNILNKDYNSALKILKKISENEPEYEPAKSNLNFILSRNFQEELRTGPNNDERNLELANLQSNWNTFGEKDPMWSILTDPTKKDNKWKPGEFFETGIREINIILDYIKRNNLDIRYESALDFGCGIGRLTQALAIQFDEVYGIDIAQSMIEGANYYNRFAEKCKYIVNTVDNLNIIPNEFINFIYTNITLQHMKPQFSKNFIKEFMRVLKKGGILIFQIPSRRLANIQKECIQSFDPQNPIMEMHGVPKETVIQILTQNSGKIVDIVDDKSLGSDWESYRYCVQKI